MVPIRSTLRGPSGTPSATAGGRAEVRLFGGRGAGLRLLRSGGKASQRGPRFVVHCYAGQHGAGKRTVSSTTLRRLPTSPCFLLFLLRRLAAVQPTPARIIQNNKTHAIDAGACWIGLNALSRLIGGTARRIPRRWRLPFRLGPMPPRGPT